VAASQLTVAGTSTLPEVRSWKVLVLMVEAFIASLNVAVTAEPTGTAVAPAAGDMAVTVGAVVSVP
jgi:hypothetical protein